MPDAAVLIPPTLQAKMKIIEPFFLTDFAHEFDEPDPGDVPFKREINVLGL